MQMDAGLDTGAMLLRQTVPISPDDTTASLHDKLARLGGELMVDTLSRLDGLVATPQTSEGITYARKISKAEAQLDWNESAETLARKIRALNPFPGATLKLEGETVKVWRAEVVSDASGVKYTPGQFLTPDGNAIEVACGVGTLRLLELQMPGGRRITSTNWLQAKRSRKG